MMRAMTHRHVDSVQIISPCRANRVLHPPHALQLLREKNAPLRQKNERFQEYASVIKEKTSSKPNQVSTGHARKEAHRSPGSAQAAVCITSPVRAAKNGHANTTPAHRFARARLRRTLVAARH